MSAIKSRKPTGIVPWPLILIEGGEKAGKSWACAELSASEKVGQTYWLDLGEGSADEYGAIPGVRYEVLIHDGTWRSITEQVSAVRDEAERVAKLGEPPVVLVVDPITAEWDLLKDWAGSRARERLRKRGKAQPEDEELNITTDLWNDANSRHRKLMTILMTFPGIVVMTARGKEVAAMDDNGRPIQNSREYKVEGQKTLAYDCTVWIRVSRDEEPMVVGCRSVHARIRHGVDKAKRVKDLTLEKVIFDVLKCNPAEAHTRDLVNPQGDEPPAIGPVQMEELMALLAKAELNSKELAIPYINEAIAPSSVDKTSRLSRDQAEAVLTRLRSYVKQLEPQSAGEAARAALEEHFIGTEEIQS